MSRDFSSQDAGPDLPPEIQQEDMEAWLGGDLDAAQAARLDAALAAELNSGGSAPMAEEMAADLALCRLLAQEGRGSRAAAIGDGVMAELRRQASPQASSTRRWPWRSMAAAALVALAALGLTLSLAQQGSEEPPQLFHHASGGEQGLIMRDGETLAGPLVRAVRLGDVVITGDLPTVLYQGSDHLYIYPDSRLEFAASGWHLQRGAVRLTSDAELALATEHTQVAIAGGSALIEFSTLGTVVRADAGLVEVQDAAMGLRRAVAVGHSDMLGTPLGALDMAGYVGRENTPTNGL